MEVKIKPWTNRIEKVFTHLKLLTIPRKNQINHWTNHSRHNAEGLVICFLGYPWHFQESSPSQLFWEVYSARERVEGQRMISRWMGMITAAVNGKWSGTDCPGDALSKWLLRVHTDLMAQTLHRSPSRQYSIQHVFRCFCKVVPELNLFCKPAQIKPWHCLRFKGKTIYVLYLGIKYCTLCRLLTALAFHVFSYH